MYKKILIPVDGSQHSSKAVEQGVFIAEKFGSEILIFNVVEPFPYQVPESFLSEKKFIAKFTELGRKIISDYKKKYQRDTIKIKTAIAIGKPYVVICEKAENENFDLVIIGSRGLGPGAGYLLGSVSEKVSKMCPCPVMIVK